jgi:hypothetical protein
VVAYYWLKGAATQPLKLELLDGAGAVRACVASDTPVRQPDTNTLNVEAKWQQPQQPPSAAAGMHRYALGGGGGRGAGGFGGRGTAAAPVRDACTPATAAVPAADDAAAAQQGGRGRGGRGGRGGGGGGRGGAPLLQSGQYTVRLTVDGQSYTQPVMIKPDPRGVPANAGTGGFGGNK